MGHIKPGDIKRLCLSIGHIGLTDVSRLYGYSECKTWTKKLVIDIFD